VDETDIASISKGQRVEVQLDSYPDRVLSGVVDHVAYEAELVENVTVYKIDVLPENPPEFLRSGMTATLTFVVKKTNDVLLLPAEACASGIVLMPGEPPVKTDVETGMEDGKMVEIVAGLKDGDTVLVEDNQMAATGVKKKGNPLLPWNRMPTRRPPRH
jgi:macrolide-specific efflux system membrane fusion protein